MTKEIVVYKQGLGQCVYINVLLLMEDLCSPIVVVIIIINKYFNWRSRKSFIFIYLSFIVGPKCKGILLIYACETTLLKE